MKPMIDRNKEITRRVLMGETMTSLAKEFGISAPRIRQIIARTCRLKNEQWFVLMPGYNARNENNGWGLDLKWLRDHKRIFIDEHNAICTPDGTQPGENK